MSTYEIRAFDAAGQQDKVLSGAVMEFTDELGAEGFVKATLSRQRAEKLAIDHRLEVAVFRDGVELDGSRARLVETTGNPSSSEDAPGLGSEAVWGGRTLHAATKSVITYPANWPMTGGAKPTDYKFPDKTPGFILDRLISDARARGAGTDFETNTWSATEDSNGVAWAKTLKLEYKPGADLQSIIENMVRLGAIEFRWRGRELMLYNAETFGEDLTTGPNTVCLYRGREVSDSPYSESSEEIVNTVLVIGDDGILVEKTDAESVALYGRREGALSQGGTKDIGMLTYLGESTLARSSRIRGEYTVKVEEGTSQDNAIPFVDYKVGDWILYDRVPGQPPEKLRVRQISVTPDNETQSTIITLNDKFAELDLRTSKKVDGILGGAAMDGSTPTTDEPEVDLIDPSPPTNVGSTSDSYTEPHTGITRAVATTEWVPPTTNEDGSALTDLAGFDVEHRATAKTDYTLAESWYPLRIDPRLQARWDRRGKDSTNAWMGADGGASVRDAGGMDWFFWSDTYWGTVDQEGNKVLGAIARNSITKSDPTTLNDLTGFFGQRNLIPEDLALLTDAGAWSQTDCTASIVNAPGGGDGRWLEVVAGSGTGNSYAYKVLPQGTIVGGRTYHIKGKIDPGTSPDPRIYVAWYAANGSQMSLAGTMAPGEGGWATGTYVAPTEATTCYVLFSLSAAATEGQWARFTMPGVFETTHGLQTWQPPLHSEVQYNEVLNPDGVDGVESTSTTQLLHTNYQRDPFFDFGDGSYNAAGMVRDSTRAYRGTHSLKITGQGTTTNGHNGTLLTTDTVLHSHVTFTTKVWVPAENTTLPQIRIGGSGVVANSFDLPANAVRDSWVGLAGTVAVNANGNAVAYLYGSSAAGEEVWFDALDFYVGEFNPSRAAFDGNTETSPGLRAQWDGAPGASSSSLWLDITAGSNDVANPVAYSDLTDWYVFRDAAISRNVAEFPGKQGLSGPLPEVVNAGALTAWATALGEAATRSVGIGVIGDSCTESTGDPGNPDLSDRFIERLQLALRRETAVPTVPLDPPGYYGASTYVPVGYIHGGPIDWTFETADETDYPLSGLHTGGGAGGRARDLQQGHRAHFTATFSRLILAYGTSGWGRTMRISIDGVERTNIDTLGSDAVAYWNSGYLGPASEHTVVVEYIPTPGLVPGSVRLFGADIYNSDEPSGVRVYDFSGSGKAAQDVASRPHELDANFAASHRTLDLLIIKLGFNDFGRSADWGGPRTAAQFKADVQAIIAGARARGFTGPTLLLGQWHAPQLTPGTTGETQENFRAQLSAIASADAKVAFMDLSTVMPPTDYAPWGEDSYYVDGLHPTTKGHARVAEILSSTLSADRAVSGPASVQVLTSGLAAQEGVRVHTDDETVWAVGTTYAGGTWVKAPVGAAMELRTLCAGNNGVTDLFTGTGAWQWVVSTPIDVQAGATAAPVMYVRTATGAPAQKISFYVTKAIISDRAVRKYVDGSTVESGVIYSWSGTPYRSTSVGKVVTPTGWSGSIPGAASTVVFDPNEYVQGEGSVRHVAPIEVGNSYMYFRYNLALPAGKHASISVTVKADWGITRALVRPRVGSTYIGGTASEYLTAPNSEEWYEIRWNGVMDQAADHLMVVLYGDIPKGGQTWITEATIVLTDGQPWNGTPFHGGQSGHNVVTEWEGVPHQSRTKGSFYNSSSAPSLEQPGGLLHPGAAGGNLSEYIWVTGAVAAPDNKAWVFCNGMRDRALRDGGGWNFQRNGEIYVAEFDMGTNSISRWFKWFTDPRVQWGAAALIHNGYLYVYGESSIDGTGQTYLLRTPLSGDPFANAIEYRHATGWTGTQHLAVPINTSTAAQGGFTAVREFGGEFIAMHVAGWMDHIDGYSAPAPHGPWTHVGSVMEFAPSSSNKYVARFHPQMDDAQNGIAVSYSQSGEDVYGVQFARGPKGSATAEFGPSDVWVRHPVTEASPDHVGGLVGDWAFQARVRSRDDNDRVSDWVEAPVITLAGDYTAPPKPATPLAESFFNGARITVSSLTASGAAYPTDFLHLTVHQGTSEDFVPDDTNLIDTLSTRGGVVIASGLGWGVEYFWKVLAWDTTENVSEPSEAASASGQRLSDPALPADLIDGAKHIKDESLSLKNFSQGAFGNTIVPNGTMQEWDGESELPTGWEGGWPRGSYTDWETAAKFSVDEANPISGGRSLRIDVPAISSRQVLSAKFPVVPGDIYYVSMKVRTSRKLSSNFLQPQLLMGAEQSDVNGFASEFTQNTIVATSDGGAGEEIVTIEGQVEVLDRRGDGSGTPHRWAAFGFDARSDGDRGYTVWLDDVEVRQVVGSAALANASINRAHIRYLAVDDARIASLGVGKLVAGELWADITVSSRIMTAKSGQRVELNKDGLFGFNGTDSYPVTEIRSDNGGLISRWIRTNTDGQTRIEMGSYGMGANSALMSFYPQGRAGSASWQFPPAVGFGGDFRDNVNSPGLGIHAGSVSNTDYLKYGMNMIGVQQAGGIGIVTGNLLDGTQASVGADITLNAGGSEGYVNIIGGGQSRSYLHLGPRSGDSMLRMNQGQVIYDGDQADYSMGMAGYQYSDIYTGFRMRMNEGFRVETNTAAGTEFALFLSAPDDNNIQHRMRLHGVYEGNGWNGAAKIRSQGGMDGYVTLFWDGTNFGMVAYTHSGVQTGSKTF